MSRKRHPELEGYASETLYTFELSSQRKKRRSRLIWTSTGLLLGLGLATGVFLLMPLTQRLTWVGRTEQLAEDPYALGLGQAMDAAELTQTAEFQEDWSRVAILWQQAIGHMQAVPASNSNHDLAQQKIAEYSRNLKYAQSNVDSRAPSDPRQISYWTIGSDRELVFDIQGLPNRIYQYDTTCKEVLYYGDSAVELENGYVVDYSDADANLKVLGDKQVALSFQANDHSWTLGSTQQDVFEVQGTPTRTSSFQEAVTLHYGDSSVELKNNQVVAYSNAGNNLKVSMTPVALWNEVPVAEHWSLGDSRNQVLQVEQQTPTAVSRLDTSCKEVFTFGENTVTFRKGLVSEFANFSYNLKVQ
jgi:hypothetical protein